jgi:DNA-binding transcriptional MerR regulator
MNEPAYWAKEVAEALQISDSTLRKWCIALEKNGYEFTRGTNNSRAFVERDIIVLRRMKELVQGRGVTVEHAANAVISSVETDTRTTGVHEANEVKEVAVRDSQEVVISTELLKQILERQERLEALNQELLRRLDEQQRYINERLERRDQQLMEAMRQVQETQRLIATSQEEAKQKRGLIARLFGK